MIHIAVCEDDRRAAEQAEQWILELQTQVSEPFAVSIYYSGESFARAVRDGCPFDIIVMDIELGGINGIAAGELLRKDDDNDHVQLIYMSSHEEYHLQLFDVMPSGFIRKPVQPEMFRNKLIHAARKAVRRREQGQTSFLPIQLKGKEALVPYRDILYLESKLRKVLLHAKTGCLEYYSTLKQEEQKLQGVEFVRIHQSYIVNFAQVREIRAHTLLLLTGQELPISGKYQTSVRTGYLKFRSDLVE